MFETAWVAWATGAIKFVSWLNTPYGTNVLITIVLLWIAEILRETIVRSK